MKIEFKLPLILLCSFFYLSHEAKSREFTLQELEQKWPNKKHSFISLKSGQTHYEYTGAKTNKDPLVVMVHGVSGPMTAWDKNISMLNDNNISFLRYDLYGRGFSERISTHYNLDLYISQLEELIAKIEINKRIVLIGSSFGCVIVSAYANKHIKQVEKVIFIGPAGFPIKVPFLAKMRDIPVLGDFIFKLRGKELISEQNQKYFVDDTAWDSHKKYFQEQLTVEGSDKAILSTMRHSPVQNFLEGYKELGQKKIPVEVIWGKNDITFPYHNNRLLKKKIPHMQLMTIKHSAHLPQFERPEQVNKLLLRIIKNKE